MVTEMAEENYQLLGAQILYLKIGRDFLDLNGNAKEELK